MKKHEVIRMVLDGKKPPYVPWSFKFTLEPKLELQQHYQVDDLDEVLGNHILQLGSDIGFFDHLGGDLYQDVFGVTWDRGIDKDIGDVSGCVLPGPTLAGYRFPDPLDPRFFANIESEIHKKPEMFRVFQIGFSLYERAWSLRGIENLLMDFLDEPEFVHELMDVYELLPKYRGHAPPFRHGFTFSGPTVAAIFHRRRSGHRVASCGRFRSPRMRLRATKVDASTPAPEITAPEWIAPWPQAEQLSTHLHPILASAARISIHRKFHKADAV